MFSMGTHNSGEIYRGEFIIPGRFIVTNLATIIRSRFISSYLNSVYVSVVATAVSVFISALTGFALSKYKFRLKKAVYFFIIGTMMIPAQLGLVAYVLQMRMLGLADTHLPLFIIYFASPFGVFWMTQFITSSVPNEVIESARIDGCREISIFIRIIIPYIKPAIITLSMLVFLWSWNNYLLPLIILNKDSLFTIPLALARLNSGHEVTDYGARLMALSCGTLPLILIFAIGAKYFIRGLTAGAVKG
jgi:multiple sugar transport system permease protein/cellobiose transport system permease protein